MTGYFQLPPTTYHQTWRHSLLLPRNAQPAQRILLKQGGLLNFALLIFSSRLFTVPYLTHATPAMKFHRQILLCVLWLCSHARAQVQTANAIQKLLEENEGNSTALSQLKSAPWVNSPTVRGSIEILWTCLVTLVACVYTVLHLNIPPKTGQWANLLNKIRWVCIAIILPETVVFLAARQLSEAIGLKKALQEQLMANGDERTVSLQPLRRC